MKRLLALTFVLLLVLAGCGLYSPGGHGNTQPYISAERAKYFQGQRGIEARFDQMPPKLYYYDTARTSAVNDFPFGVEVWNRGSSYSRGAIFVSGYDPHIVEIDEIRIASTMRGACSLRIGDYSLNKIGMMLSCGDNFVWRGNEDNWLQSIRVRGKQWFNSKYFDALTFDFNSFRSGGNRFDITIDDTVLTLDQREHGIMLISILAGLSFSDFLGQDYLLAGNTYDYPGGEMDFLSFHGHLVNWPQGADEIPQRFLLTNCYMYTTFAAPIVCIDPSPYSENRKVCTPFMGSWSSGQGAPVAITRVQQENTPRTAIFHVTVRNVGGGIVYDPGSLEKCSPYYAGGARASDLNVVWLGYVRIGDRILNPDRCTPDAMIRLVNGEGSFTCTYPIEYAELNSAYQTPLVIELWYGYQQSIYKDVLLKRVT